MVLKMEDKELIRRLVNIQGMSQREVHRRFGWSRDSIAEAIKNPEPNSYTLQAPRPRPITDPFVPLVKQWPEEDKAKPRKQRHKCGSASRFAMANRVAYSGKMERTAS